MLGFKPLPNEEVKKVDPQASFLSDFVVFVYFTCSNSMTLILWSFSLRWLTRTLKHTMVLGTGSSSHGLLLK
jgi:hypothetical protein